MIFVFNQVIQIAVIKPRDMIHHIQIICASQVFLQTVQLGTVNPQGIRHMLSRILPLCAYGNLFLEIENTNQFATHLYYCY